MFVRGEEKSCPATFMSPMSTLLIVRAVRGLLQGTELVFDYSRQHSNDDLLFNYGFADASRASVESVTVQVHARLLSNEKRRSYHGASFLARLPLMQELLHVPSVRAACAPQCTGCAHCALPAGRLRASVCGRCELAVVVRPTCAVCVFGCVIWGREGGGGARRGANAGLTCTLLALGGCPARGSRSAEAACRWG